MRPALLAKHGPVTSLGAGRKAAAGFGISHPGDAEANIWLGAVDGRVTAAAGRYKSKSRVDRDKGQTGRRRFADGPPAGFGAIDAHDLAGLDFDLRLGLAGPARCGELLNAEI